LGARTLLGSNTKASSCPARRHTPNRYIDNAGLVSGGKPCIYDGLKTQIKFDQGAIEEVIYMHPAAASIATVMIHISVKFCDTILILIDKMTTKHAARRGEVKPDESWLQIRVIVWQVFREPRKVRQKGVGAFNSSVTRHVGQSEWYILQAHLKNGGVHGNLVSLVPCHYTCLHKPP
jgi:hypothetical protein